ncbi:MAG TPA: HD domain-containing protein [Fibrobacteria bacterium]|nr:HD domain-containing protein [Fibrobacteria bacterium]
MTAALPSLITSVAREVAEAGGEAYLVGGWVRDRLLGIEGGDYDIEVYGLALDPLMNILKRHGKPSLVGKAFGVITLTKGGVTYDFAFPRTERKVGDGHKGFEVTADPMLDFATASSRRDFTINAMGMRLPDLELVDCHGGRDDLARGVLRHVSDAFSEDPLRALRAVQFAARFNFEIAPATRALCAAQPLQELPRERLFAEFKKLLLKSARPSVGLEWMRRMGLLRFFPELEALVGVPQEPEWHCEGDVWTHTLMVVDQAARLRAECGSENDALAHMLAALCHDLGKADFTIRKDGRWRSPAHESGGDKPTRAFLARLTNETDLVDGVVTLVREHLKPTQLYNVRETLRPAAIRRLALRVDIAKLVRLARADHLGRTTEEALEQRFPAGDWLLEESKKLDVLLQKPAPFLTGKFLLSLGLKPGPELGKIIAESFELQLEGEIPDLAAAEAWAKRKVEGRR